MTLSDITTATEAAEVVVGMTSKIAKIIENHKRHIEVKSQELSIRVPEGAAQLSFALGIRSGLYGGKIMFNVPRVTRLAVRSSPAFKREDQTVLKEGDVFGFDASRLPKDTETVLLDLEYTMEDPEYLDALVQRRWQLDPQCGDDVEQYWMTAQFKHLKVLREMYAKLDLQSVDMRVDVGVHQDIKTKIPHKAMKSIERASEFIGTRDREKLLRLMLEQRRNMEYVGKDLLQSVRKVTDLFLPTKFAGFVEVNRPFRLSDCLPGAELMESLLLALPKFMTVVSRTDLTLDEPAREGNLLYHRRRVQDAIEKIFS
jgi:hypothetical protein